MHSCIYIKKLIKKVLFTLLLILLYPQVSFCWNVIESDGYVRAESEYNGGYIFIIELASNDKFSYERPSWQIKATSDLQEWIKLSNEYKTYGVYIDGVTTGTDNSVKLKYDIGSNSALIRGNLSESLLQAIKRGNSFSIRYSDDFSTQATNTLISLNLDGSSSAIETLKYTTERAIKVKRNKKYAYIGIASLIGLLIAYQILKWAFRKTKTIAKKITNTSHELSLIFKNKVAESRRNKLYNKIEESVLDEIVREALRRAIREGIKPDDIKLCTICLGEGCNQCNGKGWIVS